MASPGFLTFLTEEQLSLRDMARYFAEKEVAPVSKVLESGDLDTLKMLWGKMGELGLTGLPFPEEYGGSEVDSLSYFLVLEEIAKVSAALATALSVHISLVSLPLLENGSEEQKAQYLPDLVAGRKIGAFCLTEPNAGSDAGSGLVRADKNETGYVMNGTKIFITNALLADVFLVTGRTDTEQSGSKGLSAFILERGCEGLNINKGDHKMGLIGGDWGEIHLDNCHISAPQRLSEEGKGFKIFMKSLNIGRISIAIISMGIAEACLAASVQYAKERNQFGKPIAEFQAIQFKLADMGTKIEAARGLIYNAARMKQAGLDYAKEASMAKLYASEIANECATEAVQIHGGYGYTTDFPVERYFRDARVMSLFEGTSEIQRIIIARQLLK